MPRGRVRIALVGGLATTASYGIVLWAMTQAPIAVVAALRETSMIFVLAMAVIIFKERAGLRRYAATALIACGAGCDPTLVKARSRSVRRAVKVITRSSADSASRER